MWLRDEPPRVRSSVSLHVSRARAAWWGLLAVLAVALALFVAAFVGTFTLGLFLYYAVRPLHRHLLRRVERRWASASLTLLLVILPVLVLTGYVGLAALRDLLAIAGPELTDAVLANLPGEPDDVGTLVRSLTAYLGRLENLPELEGVVTAGVTTLLAVGNGLLHLTLALAFTFFLLRDGPRLAAWFRSDVAEEGAVADAYLTAVDADLEAVYFGNILTVLLVGVLSLVVYHGFDLVAPAGLALPFPTLAALLTGLATFVPLVVGKVVYLPVTASLLWQALRADAGAGPLSAVALFLVVSFVVLDFVPQTFVRPYVSGGTLHSGLVLFAYVLGAALFGWYGLFLGPLVAVLVVQAANVVLPELLHGEQLTPATYISIGSDPPAGRTADDATGTGSAGGGGTRGPPDDRPATTTDAAAGTSDGGVDDGDSGAPGSERGSGTE
jgi:predicted PurR-regulated permease PerM